MAVPMFIPVGPELLVLALIIIVLFVGPRKIPEIARSTGKAAKEFQRGREESQPQENDNQ